MLRASTLARLPDNQPSCTSDMHVTAHLPPVQIPWAHATLSTKEKSRCVIVADREAAAAAAAPAGSGAAAVSSKGQQQQDKVFVAEPVAFYKLESGEQQCSRLHWQDALHYISVPSEHPPASAMPACCSCRQWPVAKAGHASQNMG